MAEERERFNPDADYVRAKEEGDDVEGHVMKPKVEEDKYASEDKYAATEEPPDVEGHRLAPKHKP